MSTPAYLLATTTDYIFFGWKINGEGSFITSINNVSEDINIIGSFNVKMYTITFVEENGVYYSPITAKKNVIIQNGVLIVKMIVILIVMGIATN